MRTVLAVDPDRDEARRLLEQELRDPSYEVRESLVLRAWRWITDRLPSLDLPGQLPSWAAWALLAVVLLAAAAVVAFAARDRWRRSSTAAGTGPGAVLDETGVTAATYRRRALSAAAQGDHDGALLDAYRAVAAGAVERTLLDDRPGRTAHEVAVALTALFPDEAGPLASAADGFDAVRYGGGRAAPEQPAAVLDLHQRIASGRPVLADASPGDLP